MGDAVVSSVPSGDRWTIYLDGFIDARGVSLVAAMTVGRLLREHHYETNVGARADDAGRLRAGVCYSGCPFAYAGGVRRSLDAGSVLGVHRAGNRVPVPDDFAFQQVVSRQVTQYLAEMAVSAELLASMSRVRHDTMALLTRAEAERLNLVNERPGPAGYTSE